jgi:predicted permease
MSLCFCDFLAVLPDFNTPGGRLAVMFLVLATGVFSGYLASSRFGLSQQFARTIMVVVLVCFHWIIAFLLIWRMQLHISLIWLPLAGVILMLSATAISVAVFSFVKVDHRSRLTLVLAGSLSNIGYTGAAFVCYGLFGTAGLAFATVSLLFWTPAVYLVFFPLLKLHELRVNGQSGRFGLRWLLDPRCFVVPAAITAFVLNLAAVKPPAFISRFYIVDILVYIASGLSFFAIGLRVRLSRLRSYKNLYLPLLAIKFVATPLAAFLLLYLLSITGRDLTALSRNVIVVLSLAPSGVLMVTLSNVFDLDGPLASALWVVTTLVFILVVIPVLFLVFT